MIENSNILVIGANSRVAFETMRLLAPANQLFMLARNDDKLVATKRELGRPDCWSGTVDFSHTDATQALIESAWAASGGIDIVLIAHGLLGEQIATEHEYPLAREVIDTNFSVVVAQLITLSKLMKRRGQGKIAVLTSVAGDRGRPRNYTYGAAKGALGLYLQGLRSSLWDSGIEIYNFKLGPVDTPMTTSHHKDFSFSRPEAVAASIIKALQRRSYCAYIPGFWRPVMWVVRNLPEGLFQRLKFLSGR